MKIINLILISLITINSYSQQSLNTDSVEIYFLKYLNEYRKTLYGDSVVEVKINHNASLACKHHNNYLFDMLCVDKIPSHNVLLLSHGESADVIIEIKNKNGNVIGYMKYKYVGNNTLIPNYADRITFYNTNKDFGPHGEVITGGYYPPDKFNTDEMLAKKFFENFMGSQEHKETLSMYNYNFLALDCKVEINGNYLKTSIVVVTGTSTIDSKK
jgi:hypothetical protein